MPTERREYLPALRFPVLTGLYDPVARLATREGHFKGLLIRQASPSPGQRVLDIGCGTGTLAIELKRAVPGADVVGLDADPEMLKRAEAKASEAGTEIRFDEGYSTDLPYEDGSFDRVLSTLFFHHLDPGPKRRTVEEIARVLRPGGELHVADWGRPGDPVMAVASIGIRVFDGLENTRDNIRGALPEIFNGHGLAGAEETRRLRTFFGTLSFYRASRAA